MKLFGFYTKLVLLLVNKIIEVYVDEVTNLVAIPLMFFQRT